MQAVHELLNFEKKFLGQRQGTEQNADLLGKCRVSFVNEPSNGLVNRASHFTYLHVLGNHCCLTTSVERD